MKEITFKVYGHENTLSFHKNSIEFTKEDYLTKRGDCILGINADFDINKIKEFVKDYHMKKAEIKIKIPDIEDSFTTIVNSEYDSGEMVIRKSDFLDKRTFGIRSTKAAVDIDRRIVEYLLDESNHAEVVIEKLE